MTHVYIKKDTKFMVSQVKMNFNLLPQKVNFKTSFGLHSLTLDTLSTNNIPIT